MKIKKIYLVIACLFSSVIGDAQNQIIGAEYYLLDDPGFGNAISIDISSGETISEAISAELEQLGPGTHFAYVRVQDENDMWSIPLKVPFRVQNTELPDISYAEWYIDNDPSFGEGNPIDLDPSQDIDGLVQAETESLEAGRHNAYIRFQNQDGTWGIPLKRPFILNDKIPLDVVAAEYFIDQDPGFGNGETVNIDPAHFVEDSFLASLSEDIPLGDHVLYSRVQNEDSLWSINIVRTFTVDSGLGFEERILDRITVYPNPTSGPITINSDEIDLQFIEIIDSRGQLISEIPALGKHYELDHLDQGMYLLRIITSKGQLTKSIVVE
ncbi:MAG: T9SS type A sorting domain-containing protein [Flavobacteriales bacterium]|nr:T9SS type A sorting domain-containing protein [Flavobacteriales bacterium]NNK80227.1 T9SS type A sorting domain-containing protein [Flavobacteriales bacterium]